MVDTRTSHPFRLLRFRNRIESAPLLSRFVDHRRTVLPVKGGGWLCCKNNSVGETEPTANLVGRLFSLQSEDFPDELNLPKDVPFRQPPHLAFPDHVQNLVALNRPPGSIERSKTLAGIHPPLDPSMVLFHNIV